MIGRSDWYQENRGYKANIVTYTLAWLINHLERERRSTLDLARIWKLQEVPDELQVALAELAPRIAAVLKNPPASVKNVSEYAKQQACWSEIARTEFPLSEKIDSTTVDLSTAMSDKKDAASVKKIDDSIEFEMTLYNLRDKIDDIRKVGMNHHLLSPKSIAALEKLRQRNKILNKSETQRIEELV